MAVGKIDGLWSVNGIPIYTPTSVQIDHENVVNADSGRTESGTMRITWLRRDVRKVNMSYNYLTGNEVDFMVNLMQGRELSFTYEDNGQHTIQAYVGKCSYTQHNLMLCPDEGGLYQDFKINVIEM